MENDVEVSGRGLIWGSVLAIYFEGMEKTTQEPHFLQPMSELSGPGTSQECSRGATQWTSLFSSYTELIVSKGRKVNDASKPLWVLINTSRDVGTMVRGNSHAWPPGHIAFSHSEKKEQWQP